MVSRESHVSCTRTAAELIHELVAAHGPLIFHQSGGCCRGFSPMCFPSGEFCLDEDDVHLGDVEGCPFYVSRRAYAVCHPPSLVVDAVPGCGPGLSLEALSGRRFVIRT